MAKSDSNSVKLVDEKPADRMTSGVLDALAGGWTKSKAKARPRRSKTYWKGSARDRWHLDWDEPF